MAFRNKSKYQACSKKHKHPNKLEPGMSGFLCTCNGKFRERDCVRESYNILNEYGDEIFGTQAGDSEKGVTTPTPDENKDVEALLADEIESMKAETNRHEPKRFQVVESGANGVVFIKSTVPDPVKLAHAIVSSYAKGVQKSKFLLRLLPVEVTCKAYLDEISTAIQPLLQKYFSGEGKTFAIVFNHRNNDSLKRDEIIEKLAEMVTHQNILHKADLKQPQLVVLLEVIRSICCISVVPDYYSLKKYNLLENSLKGSGNAPAKEIESVESSEQNTNLKTEEKDTDK